MARWKAFIFVLITATFAFGCSGSSSTPATPAATVTAIMLMGGTSVTVGGTTQITASALWSDHSSTNVTKDATWQSADSKIVTVAGGLVTGVSSGTVSVSASYSGVTNAVAITVQQLSTGVMCGEERWAVKTLSDPDAPKVDLGSVHQTTVKALATLPQHCSALPDARTFDPEFQVYEVVGKIVVVRSEDDKDYHIALADPDDPSYTMVTETPSPICEGVVSSPFKQQMSDARTQFESIIGGRSLSSLTGATVRVRGVGFYDFAHGQTGRSQSCMELHPIIGVTQVQ